MNWREKSVITRVRLRLPRPWQPVLGYLDLQRKMEETGVAQPDARQVFDWVCAIRRAKLPDPALIGNAGSFFKNPVVTPEQCRDIIARDPHVVHYPMDDGSFKLAAGWLIDACGWKGKTVGGAGVYEKQALVLVNRGASAWRRGHHARPGDPGKRLRPLRDPAGTGADRGELKSRVVFLQLQRRQRPLRMSSWVRRSTSTGDTTCDTPRRTAAASTGR